MVALAGCAASHKATIQQPPPPQGQPLSVEFVYNLPVVDASVGDEPVRLIVDLGGHDTVTLKEETLDRLPAVTRTWRRNASLNAAGKMTFDNEIIVPELRLGDVLVTEVHGHTITLPPQLATEVDGYVGAGLLKRFRVLVDYPGFIWLLPANGPRPGPEAASWSAVRVDKRLRNDATIDGRAIKAGWDTGASHTVLDNTVAEKIYGITTGRVNGQLTLDGHEFDPIELRVIELRGAGVDVLIGHNFFMQHQVLFDFPAQITYIGPARSQVVANRARIGDDAGMSLPGF